MIQKIHRKKNIFGYAGLLPGKAKAYLNLKLQISNSACIFSFVEFFMLKWVVQSVMKASSLTLELSTAHVL